VVQAVARSTLALSLLAALAPALAGCAASPAGEARPVRDPQEEAATATAPVERLPAPPRRPPTTYVPGGPGAESYAAPPLVADPRERRRMDEFSRRLLDAVEEAAGAAELPAPIPDERRHALARDIARLSRADRPPPSEALRFLANHYGVVEADPSIFTLRGPAYEASALEHFRISLPRLFRRGTFNRVGVGWSRGKDEDRVAMTALWSRHLMRMLGPAPPAPDVMLTTVVLLWEQYLELAPVPRALPAGKRTVIAGRFLRPYTSPQLVVTLPGGFVRRLVHTLRGDRFEADLGCGFGDGRYQLEMVASDASGPLVLANFPLYCGVPAPTDVAAHDEDDPADIDPAQAEQELFSLINHDRRAAGLLPLAWDNRLAAIARAHSRDMAGGGFIAHVSPTTGDAAARLRRAGLRYPLVLENVGQEGGVRQAHQGFMNSPGHRANVLNPQIGFLGVGVVVNARRAGAPLVVTELFAGWR
jgi:uncharacterized protein YkwD